MKKLLILFLVFFLCFLGSNLSATPAVTGSSSDHLVFYYTFDDVANATNYSSSIADYSDLSKAKGKVKNTNGNSVVPSLSASLPLIGESIELDGTKYIEMGGYYPLQSLGESGNHQITISLWVRFLNTAPIGNDCFIAKNTNGGGDKFLFGIWGSQMMVRIGSNYRLQTYVDGTNGSSINVYNSAWHNFIVTIKEDPNNLGTSKATLWIDGVKRWNNLTISNVLADSDVTTGQIPLIGMDLDGSNLDKTDWLEAHVDEIQIFDSVANDDDASNLYNKRFGTLSAFNVWTSSLEYYANENGITRTHDNTDGFLYNAYDQMNKNSYEYLNQNSDFSQVAHDNDVLLNEWLANSDQSNYEVVLHGGHGHSLGIKDYYSTVLRPYHYTYSGSTRWVFYDACNTMKYPVYGKIPCSTISDPDERYRCCPNTQVSDACFGKQINNAGTEFINNEGRNWFSGRFASNSGPHAILGFSSIKVFHAYNDYNACSWTANGYLPSYSAPNSFGSDFCPEYDENYPRDDERVLFNSKFWKDVMVNNLSIWEAYKNAIDQREVNISVDPHSVEASIVYKKNTSIGFDGKDETWNSTYRGSMSSSDELTQDTYVSLRIIQPLPYLILEFPTYSLEH